MSKQDKFSVKKRLLSFRFAGEGLLAFFKAEHNAIIHLVATIAVIVLGFIFRVTISRLRRADDRNKKPSTKEGSTIKLAY